MTLSKISSFILFYFISLHFISPTPPFHEHREEAPCSFLPLFTAEITSASPFPATFWCSYSHLSKETPRRRARPPSAPPTAVFTAPFTPAPSQDPRHHLHSQSQTSRSTMHPSQAAPQRSVSRSLSFFQLHHQLPSGNCCFPPASAPLSPHHLHEPGLRAHNQHMQHLARWTIAK